MPTPNSETKKKIRVAAGIFFHSDSKQFLMGMRLKDSDSKFEDFWEFPGGKIEEGESAEQALVRETREELGCEALELKAFESFVWDYPMREVELHFFQGKLSEGDLEKLKKNAHSKLEWFTADQALLQREKILPANLRVLETINRLDPFKLRRGVVSDE